MEVAHIKEMKGGKIALDKVLKSEKIGNHIMIFRWSARGGLCQNNGGT